MSAPRYRILTQHPVTIDLSRPAMSATIRAVHLSIHDEDWVGNEAVQVELANFCNLLQNLLNRSEPEPENLDLIGG